MTADEALELARRVAEQNGWLWLEPVRVTKKRRWLRFASWIVQTNADSRGCNVRVEIDRATGQVVKTAFWPR